MLGDGKQRKSYLYVQDCIDAMLLVMDEDRASKHRVKVFNLGTDEYCEVNDSIGWICERLGIKPALDYTGGDRGWIGDNPFIFLDNEEDPRHRLDSPSSPSEQGIVRTLQLAGAEPMGAGAPMKRDSEAQNADRRTSSWQRQTLAVPLRKPTSAPRFFS